MPLPHHDEIKEVLTYPPDYWGALTAWIDSGYGPTFAKHRDSDELGLSNYHTIEAAFREKFEYGLDFVTESSGHWAVGWMEQLVVRVLDCKCGDDVIQDREVEYNATVKEWFCGGCGFYCTESKIFLECLEYKARLDNYPVLDEEDHSRREYESMMEYLEQEVGDEHAPALWDYLFNTYSASRSEDVKYEWITEWKEANIKDDDDS